MRRAHRCVHRRLWPILAALVAILFTLALVLRPAPAPAQPVAAMETGR
jgi:hypothetical protein